MAALFGSILSTLSSSLFRKEASHTVVDEEPVRESPKPSPNRKASSTMAGLQKGRKYRVHISGGTNLLVSPDFSNHILFWPLTNPSQDRVA